MGRAKGNKWILNGLLFGAAVGTGFAAFESAGYAFEKILDSAGGNVITEASMNAGVSNIITRGVLSPFGHIVWTANSAAALWLVKGDKEFSWDMLTAPSFLRIFIFMMVLHMTWNAPFSILKLPLFDDLKMIIIGVIGWTICFRLIQVGLKQLNRARQEEVVVRASQAGKTVMMHR